LPAFGTGYPHVTNWEGGVEKRRIDFDRSDSVVAAVAGAGIARKVARLTPQVVIKG